MWDLEFRIWGLGYGVQGLGVKGLEFRVLGFRVQGFGVKGLEFRVLVFRAQALGFGVSV